MRGMRLGVAHWVGLGFRPHAAALLGRQLQRSLIAFRVASQGAQFQQRAGGDQGGPMTHAAQVALSIQAGHPQVAPLSNSTNTCSQDVNFCRQLTGRLCPYSGCQR